MTFCTLCLHETTTSPVALTCLRCGAPLIACAECCALKAKDFGPNSERIVQALLEVRHVAQEHASRPEARQ